MQQRKSFNQSKERLVEKTGVLKRHVRHRKTKARIMITEQIGYYEFSFIKQFKFTYY